MSPSANRKTKSQYCWFLTEIFQVKRVSLTPNCNKNYWSPYCHVLGTIYRIYNYNCYNCHFAMHQGVSEYFWSAKVQVHIMGRRMVLHLKTGSQLKSDHPSFPHAIPSFVFQRITALAASPHLQLREYWCERGSIAHFMWLQIWLGLCKRKSLQREEVGEVQLLPADSLLGKRGAKGLCVSPLCSLIILLFQRRSKSCSLNFCFRLKTLMFLHQ